MKNQFINIVFVAMAITFSSAAQADQLSLFGGLNSTEFDGAGSWDRDFGLELGASYVAPLQGNLSLRSGAGIVQKNSELNAGAFSRDVEFLMLEIPATLMYKLNQKLQIFGGLNLDITLADDGTQSESFAVNLPLGGRYNIQGPHSVEAILELGVTDIMDADVKIGNSLSFRYLYDFSVRIN